MLKNTKLNLKSSVIANAVKQSGEIATPYGLAMTEQSGRSMVEMLGVLAVIGVLSVAGVGGYTTAMNKHRANELLNEASKRATVIAMQLASGKAAPESADNTLITEFTDPTNHTFKVGKANDKQFNIEITGISESVCQQMKNASGGVVKGFKPDTCADNATVILTYNNDMSTADTASETTSCTLTASDCLSGALLDGECACTPATDETECTSWTTNECGKGKYCQFSPSGCRDNEQGKGKCQSVGHIDKSATVEGDEYTMGDCTFDNVSCDWWSAQSWCKAHGKTMVSLSDIHCTSSGCTDTFWKTLANALYPYSSHTTDMDDSCKTFTINLDAGSINKDSRHNNSGAVLCRE